MGPRPHRRRRALAVRRRRRVLLAMTLAVVAGTALVPIPGLLPAAEAQEQNTQNIAVTSANAPTTATQTQPSGLQVTYGITEGTGNIDSVTGSGGVAGTGTMSAKGGTNALFAPDLDLTRNALYMNVDYGNGSGGTACVPPLTNGATSTCANRGTITINFSQPVDDPTLHLTGLGGNLQNNSVPVLVFSGAGRLTGSQGATAATFGPVAAGTNLTTTSTTWSTGNPRANPTCTANLAVSNGATAGCGSIPVRGTGLTQLTMAIDLNAICLTTSCGTLNTADASEQLGMVVTTAQDWGDAPTSYNGTQAPAHAVTNLRLGSTVDDEDALTQANQTTSPYAVAAGSSANGSNGDGADEDAFGSLPDVLAQGTAPYTLSVPISGATKPGTVAGWIDFNRNGVFDTGERAAATFVAGATSATLTFAKPAGLTAGTTYARFRTSYVATEVAQPTGLASSGEVEDYSLTIASEAPALSLVKSAGAVVDANSSGRQDAGDTVPYTFTVTNTGNTVLQGVAVTDPKIPSVACSTTTLAVGASTTCTGSYTLTQADVEAGSVPNTATANAQSPNGTPASATASTTRSVTRTPAITLAKTAGALDDVDGNGPDVGDTIPYTFTITNSGNVALATTRVDDAKVGTVSCPTGSLAPGATRTCSATYTLTQADVDAGRVVNTATASGTSAAGNVTSAEATATRTFTPASSFGFTKQAAPVVDVNTNGRTDAGDTVRYTFAFTNTGATTLSGAAVSDPRVGPVTCPTTAVAPGGSVSCTRTYTLTQADVDSGAVNNTATGTMTAPEGRPAPASRTASVSTPITAANTLALVKSAGPVVDANGSGRQDAGDTIAYSFRLTNNGNQTLSAPAVTDPKVGTVSCGPTSIAPGATITCTATYRLTQADVDAGQVANTATATAADPRGFAVASGSSSTTTTVTRVPSLVLDKIAETAVDADADGRIDAGDTVRYRFEVRNSGTVTLDPVRVTDTRLGAVTCPTGPLAPGATVACTPVVYSLTQADADAGSVNNTATATGTPPAGAAVTSTDSTSTSFAVTATVALAKTAGAVQDLDGNGPDAGDRIAYGFTVTNTGTASLTGVRLTDPRLGGAVACTPTTLAGGATATCSGTYTLTQADVDAGQVANTATVEATGPQGQVVRDTATATRTFTPASSFVLDKQAGAVATGADGRVDAGDTVPYSFVLTNTGSTTLRAADVSDPRLGPVTCPSTSIAPGASVTCTKAYVLTQADIDSGAVDNTATATMQAPEGRPQPAPSSDSTSTVLAPSGALGLTKTAGPVADANTSGRQDAGDTITYTFLVTNNGNRTLSGVSVTDPTTGPVSCPTGTLAPGQSRTCTVTYALTQADVDAGQVVNTATARATDGDGRVVSSGPATASRTVARVPSIALDKVAGTPVDTDGDGRIAAGDTIRYTFAVRNSGTVTLDPVTVADPLLGPVDCPAVALAPGATLDCTPVVLTITQAQADAGAVDNTATATGRPPTGPAVTGSDSTSTTLQRASALALAKSAGTVQDLDANGPDAGDTVAYTITARNTGTTTLDAVRVTDPLLPDLACDGTTLAPGRSLDCTGTYALTQADVDAGRVVNTASATATGAVAVAAEATATRPFTPVSSFTLDKQAAPVATGPDGRADAGDTIAYSFVLTNTGATTLSGAAVDDPRLGAVTCPTGSVAPGASVTCTRSYVLTRADVDSGAVNNLATATLEAPEGRPQPQPRTDETSTTLDPADELLLEKVGDDPVDANDTDRLDAGDTVTYTFTVTNGGNRTLTDVVVDDPRVDVTCPEGELAPGASRTCTATDTITQADLDEGEVVNTATATAAAPGGALVESDPATETTPLPTTASVRLDKAAGTPVDADEDGRTSAGDTIRYTFEVENTGTVTLDPVTVDDPLLGDVTCPAGPLRPGDTVECTPVVLTISQAQADAGAVDNTATATGTPPEGDDVTSVDSTSTPLVRASSLSLNKASEPVEDLDGNGPDAGDRVAYTLVVTNTGTTTLDDVVVTDPLLPALDCAPGTLAPGDATTCTGTLALTQADVDAGQVVNTATAAGTDQQGVDVDTADTETRTFAPRSSFSLDKVAADPTDVDGDGRVESADSIDYDFVLTNTGATTLSGAEVDDPRVGPVTCPDGPVAPGASTTCSTTYDLTQADVDAGAVNNTATATLEAPDGRPQPDPATDSTSTTLTAANTLVLDKQAGPVVDANDSDRVDAGDTVTYTFTVRNDGNQTLTDVGVDDPLVAVACPDGDLEPGGEVDCTATYTLTQADVDAGEVVNAATASATGPRGVEVTSAEDSTRTELARVPDVALDKVADTPRDVDEDGRIDADDTIRYTFVVTNTGTVTLDEVELSDPLVDLDGLVCGTGGLAPGRSVECAVRVHTITQEQVDAGSVDNTATVTARSPAGEVLDATDSTSTPTSTAVALTLDKTSVAPTDPDGNGPDAGDVVAYSFLVTNTGSRTLTDLVVADPLAAVDCPVDTLAPGGSTTCTATHALTQAEVDAGRVVNTATADAVDPAGTPATATDTETRPFVPRSAFTLDKQASAVVDTDGDGAPVEPGDAIEYDFVLANTGATTLSGADVDDPRVGPVTCPEGTVAPGASVTCERTYVLTQQDIDSGAVNNTATATLEAPDGRQVPQERTDSTSTTLVAANVLAVEKSAGPVEDANDSERLDAGDTIDYTVTVTNDGNQTLTDVTVTDELVDVTCPTGDLAPGASVDCTATYTLTQADVDAGEVVNEASAEAVGPRGTIVPSGTATTTTTLAGVASIALDKVAEPPRDVDDDGRVGADDTIRYTFRVENTGTVTLEGVRLDDALVDLDGAACGDGRLVPGQVVECAVRVHTITQAEVDAGAVDNEATVVGTPPEGPDVDATDATSTPTTVAATLSLAKSSAAPTDPDANGVDAGDVVAYSFAVTNTGTRTLTGLAVSDPLVGAVTCPDEPLAPGETVTCTGTHALTQAEVDAGAVVNEATATAEDADGTVAEDTDTDTRPLAPTSSFALDKQASAVIDADGDGGPVEPGDTIAYTFVLTNDGGTTLSAADVDDPRVGPVTCPDDAVAPGGSVTCERTYVVTQGDIDAGAVNNTATATMQAPAGRPVPVERTDSTSTALVGQNELVLEKTAGPVVDDPTDAGTADVGRASAGDTITYTFLVENTGNQTLSDVAIDDPRLGAVPCPPGDLAPGGTLTCEAVYTLTQADVDDGEVVNSAGATAVDPDGDTVLSLLDGTTTELAADPELVLDKAAPEGLQDTDADGDDAGRASAGDTIGFTFSVENTGNTTLDPVVVEDPLAGDVTCPAGPLAPGDTVECDPVTYEVTQDDVDAGAFTNEATATGTPPSGPAATDDDSTSTDLPRENLLRIDKVSGDLSDPDANGTDAGDVLDYSFTITNTGSTRLRIIAVTDPALGGTFPCSPEQLDPGQSSTCNGTYTLTQADVDAGQVTNSATGSAVDPEGEVVTGSDTDVRELEPRTSFTFDKQVADVDLGADGRAGVGDTVDYDFTLTNTGGSTLDSPAVDDPTVGDVSCPTGPLAPGASVTCTATYTLTQADVDAGAVNNTATASLDAPPALEDPDDLTDATSLPLVAQDTLTLLKSAADRVDAAGDAGTPDAGRASVGDTITYSFLVTNDGNRTLTDVAIDDPLVAAECPDVDLAPGEDLTCTATYTLTQADVDAGEVVNTAAATATGPRDEPVRSADSGTRTELAADPALLLDKVAGPRQDTDADGRDAGRASAGDTIPFTFTVTNTGNTTLDPVVVEDPLAGDVTCPTGPLAPGDSVECDPVTYEVTQDDVDAGAFANEATATGTPPEGPVVTSVDSTSTDLDRDNRLEIDKVSGTLSDPDGDGPDVGDVLDYSFTITNVGSTRLRIIAVTDPALGETFPCSPTQLDPGQSSTCNGTYTLTQADVDAGRVVNTATGSAVDPEGNVVDGSDTDTRTFTPRSSFTFDKEVAGVDLGADGRAGVGDTVDYAFTFTNTGATTLDGATVDDPTLGDVTCPTGPLAPGATTTCTATYTLTQADVDAGSVNNTATGSIDAPPALDDPADRVDDTSVALVAEDVLTLEKSSGDLEDTDADGADAGRASAGDQVTYTFLVTNNGNRTLTDVAIDDPLVAVTCPDVDLAPGEDLECAATYTLTQADLDAGEVVNTAAATATGPGDTPVRSADSGTRTELERDPELALDKDDGSGLLDTDAEGADAGRASAGDTIVFTFAVTNTGSTTLDPVVVEDDRVGDVTCPAGPLAPGDTVECDPVTYEVTQDDIDSGAFNNTATATGTPPEGPVVTSDDSTSTLLAAAGEVTLTKTAGPVVDVDDDGADSAGDTISYELRVENTGNVRLTDVAVDDPLLGGAVDCAATALDPGRGTDCGPVTYVLTQADVEAGEVRNAADVTAATPGPGDPATDTAQTLTPLDREPALVLDKEAGAVVVGADGRVDAGDTLPFTFRVRNTGNVVLTDVAVSDPLLGDVTCPTGPLAPVEAVDCTADAYVLTQADIDAGALDNLATATADSVAGEPEPSQDATSTPLARGALVQLVKVAGEVEDANDSGREDAGDTVAYTFEVQNIGNTTLEDVVVTDPLVGEVRCDASTVAPGDSVDCAAVEPYVLTQADVDAGEVLNTADVTARGADGTEVTDGASAVRDVAQVETLTLDKEGGEVVTGPDGRADAGDTIAYTFVVTNTGTTTLSGVTVDDPLVGAVDCPSVDLAPDETVTCGPVAYELTQADVDAGEVVNEASASAVGSGGAVGPAEDTETQDVVADASVALAKDAGAVADVDEDGLDSVGDTITYDLSVENTGNVTLEDVTVTDPLLGGTVPCAVDTLAPGGTTPCGPVTYVLTQADVEAGERTNTATVDATGADGTVVDDAAGTTTTLQREPALVLEKEAGAVVLGADGRVDAGDTLPFTLRVRNTGNVVLTDVAVSDPLLGEVSCPAGPLAPGDALDCTAGAYVLTQADVDAGEVVNTATATADSVAGAPEPDTDSTTTTLGRGAGVQLVKTAGEVEDANDSGRQDAGDTIAYTFEVQNLGNVTLEDVVVTDPLVGDVECDETTVAPGDSVDCAAVEPYVLTQADVDAGEVLNTADVAAVGADGTAVADESSARREVARAESFTFEKEVVGSDDGGDDRADEGDTVDYRFVVTNTGTTTLSGVTVSDPLLGAVDCPAVAFGPDESVTCGPVSYPVTQAQLDAGEVVNDASATALGQEGVVGPETDTVTTPLAAEPDVELTKTAGRVQDLDDDRRPSAGDTVTFDLSVENTGNVTLDDVSVSDPLLGGAVACEAGTLAPGASTPCGPVTYVLTQADVEAGVLRNTATVTADPPLGDAVDDTDATETTLARTATLTLDKQAGAVALGADRRVGAGDTIAYTFTVENTGNVVLTDLDVTDPLVGAVDCATDTLAPGESVTCTAEPYELTQADVDAGAVNNEAVATADSVVGAPPEQADSTSTSLVRAAAVQLEKTGGAVADANDSGRTDAGDTIAYTFVVTNPGNVTVAGLDVTDPLVGAVTCDADAVAPGGSVDCAADEPYVLTQADVDAGEVVNTATVTGEGADGEDVADADTETSPVARSESISLAKTAGAVATGADGRADAGDTVAYTFVVTNTGTSTLRGVTIEDPLVGAVSCPAGTVAPGGTVTCGPVAYPLTQADVDAGEVENTAVARALGRTGAVDPDEDTAVREVAAAPAVTLTKTAGRVLDTDGDGQDSAGDTIVYTLSVENTGNVTLTGVTVSDPLLGGAVDCAATTLAPGRATACDQVTYVLTQADVEAGGVLNIATVVGTPPVGDPVDDTAGTRTPVEQGPVLELDKRAADVAVGADGVVDAGDTITYSFTVTNRGNVALTDVAVDDPLLGEVTCPAGPVAPRGSVDCTADPYVLTQADVDAGAVNNTATATADSVVGPPQPDDDSTSTALTGARGLTLDKAAPDGVLDADDDGVIEAGDTIAYTFRVTNDGAVTLSDVAVDDPRLGDVTCPAGDLAPGEGVDCTADPYVLTQADVDAGQVVNTATASADDPDGEPVPGTDTVTTPVAQTAELELVKAVTGSDDGGDGRADAGDTIEYTFTVRNTGPTTLAGATVEDPLVGAVSCPAGPIAPGDSVECGPVDYEVTQADLDAGEVENTATARADGPAGLEPSDVDTITTPLEPAPSLELRKDAGIVVDANDTGRPDAGDTIDYTFEVGNTGNVTLDAVTVTDPLVGGDVACEQATVAPGETIECGPATYTVTEADADAGEVVNTATASGEPPAGDAVTDDDEVTTEIVSVASLEVLKTGVLQDEDGDDLADAGEVIRYEFVVTNTGTVRLEGVAVQDPMLEAAGDEVVCAETTLAAGESTTCVAEHVVTAEAAGSDAVVNVATATATGPDGGIESDADEAVVPAVGSIDGDGDGDDPGGDEDAGAGDDRGDGPFGILPDTGGAAAGLLLLALGLLAGGLLLLRRRTTTEQGDPR